MPPTPSLTERLSHYLHVLPVPILDTFSNVVFGRALAIGVRRRVFDHLKEKSSTVNELADATKLSVNGAALLVELFCSAGYLAKRGDRYSLTSESRKWLLQGSPSYIGNLIRYFETLYKRWDYLEHSLERGIPPRKYYETFGEEDWKLYVYAMRDLARLIKGDVSKRIRLAGNPQSLLDLGGSHALYSIECCRRYPSLFATVMDFESTVQFGKKIIEEQGMSKRVNMVAGDFMTQDLPQHQDCVLMFNIVHGFNERENQRLLDRVIEATVPGGRIYILDQLRTERHGQGLSGFIPLTVGLNLLNEIGGNAYSFDQMKGWCAGVASIKKIPLRLPGIGLVEIVR